ncbi:MAG: sensor histidine kinase, partial [Candidatus Electrothrix sp. LOE2]|nr:sensor histidine kinase [Candidatus Electrothrix sp. LOE2]
TSKEPGKGTGLGLSVSRSLVETAGGTMELRSTAGQGSSMLITLPLASFDESLMSELSC